jgi:hypothetical protein
MLSRKIGQVPVAEELPDLSLAYLPPAHRRTLTSVARPFQDHDVRPRMVKGRSLERGPRKRALRVTPLGSAKLSEVLGVQVDKLAESVTALA